MTEPTDWQKVVAAAEADGRHNKGWKVLTQAEYDNLIATRMIDENMLYFIREI